MLNKLLASVGIGSAKVDTILSNDQVMPGTMLPGVIKIKGGDVAQDISGFNLALMTHAEVESGDHEFGANLAIDQWRVADKMTIHPGEEKEIPFSVSIHPETPITALQCSRNKCKVWIQTGLEIDMGLDASDNDYLTVLPTEAMSRFLQAMEQSGYYLFSADVEKGYLRGQGFESVSGIYQELEFKPNAGFSSIAEVEVSFVPAALKTHALLEIDKRFGSDSYRCVGWNDNTSVQELVGQIQRLL